MNMKNKNEMKSRPSTPSATMAAMSRPYLMLLLTCLVVLLPGVLVTGHEVQALQEQKSDVYQVMEVSGDVSGHQLVAEPLHQIGQKEGLSADFLLEIREGGTLKLGLPSGSVFILRGPARGTVGDLVKAATSTTEDFVRQTLNKVPGPQNGEKKVDIATPPSGLTKAAKAQRRPMPYIWKVKQPDKKPESR